MRFYGDQARGLAMLMFAVAIGARGLKFLYCPCFLFLLGIHKNSSLDRACILRLFYL